MWGLKKKDFVNEMENNRIINKIKLNNYLIHLCFCFIRKRKNVYNTLLDESMNIISEKLDIFNLFRNMCLQDNINKNIGFEYERLKLSDECIKKLENLKYYY